MLSKKVLDLLNKQLNHELSNAMLYRQLSSTANLNGFMGTEEFCRRQYEDELTHFNKVMDYITDRNYAFKIKDPENPETDGISTLMEIFQAALKRELLTTKMLETIRQTAIDDEDQLTEQWLLWLLNEQISEEQNCYDIISMLKVAKDNPGALLLADEKIKNWEN
jgi:ferritin